MSGLLTPSVVDNGRDSFQRWIFPSVMHATGSPRRRGVTLVELVVSVGLLAAVLILVSPAVQMARESSRRGACADNIRRLGLGVLSYEDANGKFPAAVSGDPTVPTMRSEADAVGVNWLVTILPFVEQAALYDAYEHGRSPADEVNRRVRSTRLPVFLCPSDHFNDRPFMGTDGSDTASWGNDWARGNYGANSSLRFLGNDCCEGVASGSSAEGWANRFRRGVMGFNTAAKASQITDGFAATVLVLELRAGLTSFDPRGVWALGMPGSSSLWAHGGIFHDACGPNAAFIEADDVPNCGSLRQAFGGPVGLAEKGMGCSPRGTMQWQGAATRSMHGDGVFAAFADGSVHWMSDYVDVLPSSEASLSVWDRLNLSADGQIVPADAL